MITKITDSIEIDILGIPTGEGFDDEHGERWEDEIDHSVFIVTWDMFVSEKSHKVEMYPIIRSVSFFIYVNRERESSDQPFPDSEEIIYSDTLKDCQWNSDSEYAFGHDIAPVGIHYNDETKECIVHF